MEYTRYNAAVEAAVFIRIVFAMYNGNKWRRTCVESWKKENVIHLCDI